jgi:hypothetical protein
MVEGGLQQRPKVPVVVDGHFLPVSTTKLLHKGSFEVTCFARRQDPRKMGVTWIGL